MDSTVYSFSDENIAFINEAQRSYLLDEGANWVSYADDKGLTLAFIHEVVRGLRDMARDHPLHKRGAQLRTSYIFGDDLVFSDTSSKLDKFIKSESAQRTLFSASAMESLNLERFCAGNVFLFREVHTDKLTLVPVEEIEEIVRDSFDSSVVKYVRRTWTPDGQNTISQWFPTAEYRRGVQRLRKPPNTAYEVNGNYVVYILSSGRHAGHAFGAPDSLAAALWSVAYSGYLRDSARLSKALSKIAWAIVNSNNQGKRQSAVEISNRGDVVGATASLGPNQSLAGVGVPSAQVNYGNGQPLAALVAASFGIPVIALLSSPGATGGSYGAATTLDRPTINGFKLEQRKWRDFFKQVMMDVDPSVKDVDIKFPSIEQDPTYRALQSLATSMSTGAIHQDEYRQAVLNLLAVPDIHGDELPEPNDFLKSGNVSGGDDGDAVRDPVARQGNQGAVPGGFNQGDTEDEDQ